MKSKFIILHQNQTGHTEFLQFALFRASLTIVSMNLRGLSGIAPDIGDKSTIGWGLKRYADFAAYNPETQGQTIR